MRRTLLTRHPTLLRFARFACTGGLAATIQLVLLHLWTERGWDTLLANLLALLIAAQINFLLSARFTWADRHDADHPQEPLLHRWIAYHGSIIGTTLVNQAVFAVARAEMPALTAAALGIAAAGLINFVMLDRVVFAQRATAP